jgi:hypothetical protein
MRSAPARSQSVRSPWKYSAGAVRTPAIDCTGSRRTAAVRGPTAFSAAARSPKGTNAAPGTFGSDCRRYVSTPVTETAPAVRPWKPPSIATMPSRPVWRRASLRAFSFASAPELAKKTWEKPGACPTSRRAASSRSASPATLE